MCVCCRDPVQLSALVTVFGVGVEDDDEIDEDLYISFI